MFHRTVRLGDRMRQREDKSRSDVVQVRKKIEHMHCEAVTTMLEKARDRNES